MDAVAIRLGFWRWPIPLTDGWFGVPASNFFGWMLVVALYSEYTRLTRYLIREKKDERYLVLQIASPLVCYGILYSFLLLYVTVAYSLFAAEVQRFTIFAIELVLFGAIVLASMIRRGLKVRGGVEPAMSFIQLNFYVVFLAALIITGMYVQIPAMIPIAIVLLGMELALLMAPSYRLRKQ